MTSTIETELRRRPARFQFFQAVRLLRRLHPERSSVGRDTDPADEFVRFRSDLSYAFPIGDIRSIGRGDDGPGEEDESDEGSNAGRQEVVVNFMGVATPASFGSLPTPYVEEIRHQERERNRAMRDFFDLFNHRLISLFYRAWQRSRVDVLHELGEPSPFESALRAIIGLEGDIQSRRVPFDTRDVLSRSALLAMRPAPASAIEGLVRSLFDIPARVEQFLPAWYPVDVEDQTRLGRNNAILGDGASLGEEVCLCQWRFRVRLGPMNLETYRTLLPEGDAFNTLTSMIRLATGPEYDFEVTLVLDKEAVPDLHLGAPAHDDAPTCQLGWTTWLGQEAHDHDADDVLFTPSLRMEEARDTLETRP